MSAVSHIVIPVHNRRETTLACLGLLRAQGVTRWARPVVVDDGSTDGTSSAVRELFPEAEVLSGGGDLYWTGATALGMQKAMANGADFVFWLNDDTKPAPGALEELREQASAGGGAAGGVCRLPRSGLPVYAGFLRHPEGLRFIAADPGERIPCHALNGNLVCLTAAAINAAGLPDARGLPHAFGDTDYTLRLHKLGMKVTLTGDAAATATVNNPRNHASWFVGEMTVTQLWGDLARKASYAYLPAHWRFSTRHWGWRGAMTCSLLLAKRLPASAAILAIPRRWRLAVWGRRASAWRLEQALRHEENG
jgi:glycosyltransferase involved in cell wall biosynthesis